MELTEPIESLNTQLRNLYGIDTESSAQMFRIVWTEDQFEKRWMNVTPEGLQLLQSKVQEVRKYINQRNKYVLERLVVIPTINLQELPELKKSYEPLFFFMDKNNNALPPRMDVSKLVIDTMFAAMGRGNLVQYVDEEVKNPEESREKRLKEIEEYLWGNETDTGDAMAHGEAVVVPNMELKQNGI